MYNLLVVDDEVIIAKYVAQLFKDSEMMDNLLLDVRSATSAFDALDIMREEHIDIILTDVSMPGMSGIVLMEQIKKKWPHVKVILMSGYDEFEYVQAAIRNNGVDYVLKSEGEKQFIISVKKAVEELEQELRSETTIKKAAQSLKMANAILRERVIIDILEGVKYDSHILEHYFHEIDMPLEASRPAFMIIGKAAVSDTTIISNSQLYKIKVFVEEHLKEIMKCTSVVYRKRLLWLLQSERENDEEVRLMKRVINQLDGIQRICYEVLDVYISFSTDQQPTLWKKLDIKFEHLNSALGLIPAMDTDAILIGDQPSCGKKEYGLGEEDSSVEKARSAIRRLGTLVICFNDMTKERFFALFDSLMEPIRKLPPQYDGLRCEAVFVLAANFTSIVNTIEGNDKINFMLHDIVSQVRNFDNWTEVETYFRSMANKIFEERDEDDYASTNRIVDFISKYTLEHLDEELSLNRFAELLHYHPSYLSRKFKYATGETFSDYIAGIKVAKAKEMLNISNMKIADIACALGFEYPSYFTRFFKKHTGLSPQEYRSNESAKYCM